MPDGALALTLTGCFSNPLEQLAQGGAEDLVEQVTGGNVDVGAAGYAQLSESDMGELKIWIHENDVHIVSVSLIDDDGELQLSYLVGTKK